MSNNIQYEHLTRQMDIIDIDTLKQKIVIVGCGAIGSFLALSLVKMGMENLIVFDHDSVDTVNMSNQFFRFKDIGRPKAEALAELIKDFTNVDIMYNVDKFDERYKDMIKDAIVISAVDSMEVRKLIKDLAEEVGVRMVIDPRMSAEKYAQYAYPVKDFDKYARTLYSDTDAVQERCTAKSTIYTVNGAVSLIAKAVKNIISNEVYPKNIQWDVKSSSNSMVMFPNVQTAAAPSPVETCEVTTAEDESEEDTEENIAEDVPSLNLNFMRALKPSPELSQIVGTEALPRTEVVKKLWRYIKDNNLLSPENRRVINADYKLRPIFGKDSVSMFEMTKIISKHLT